MFTGLPQVVGPQWWLSKIPRFVHSSNTAPLYQKTLEIEAKTIPDLDFKHRTVWK
jgi:hypothetical protein